MEGPELLRAAALEAFSGDQRHIYCGGPGMERGRGIPLFPPLVMLSQSEALF